MIGTYVDNVVLDDENTVVASSNDLADGYCRI